MKFKFNGKLADDQLIKGCIKGNRDSQKSLYDKYSPKMFSICLRYASDYHNAEDLLQEGFIKVFNNIHKFRREGSFEGWMRRIFVNTAIEKYRKRNYLYPLLEVVNTDKEVMDDQVINKLAAEDLMELVNELSPGYKTVFNMYAVEGYPHKDIAEKLNISEGTSKSQLARARYILQKKVTEIRERNRLQLNRTQQNQAQAIGG